MDEDCRIGVVGNCPHGTPLGQQGFQSSPGRVFQRLSVKCHRRDNLAVATLALLPLVLLYATDEEVKCGHQLHSNSADVREYLLKKMENQVVMFLEISFQFFDFQILRHTIPYTLLEVNE